MENTPELSVVIPVYNERDNIRPVVDEIAVALGTDANRLEILFVNDGSTDDTLAEIAQMAETVPVLHWLSFERNCGQTAAFDAGLRHARGRYIAMMDGDLQNDPADIPLLMPYFESADLVCGYRTRRNDSVVRRISSRIANGVRNRATGDDIIDVGCSLRVMRRECVAKLKLYEGMHRFFPTLVKMEGFRVVQVPVNHRPRLHGTTKYGIANRLFRALADLLAVMWMQRRQLQYSIREKG